MPNNTPPQPTQIGTQSPLTPPPPKTNWWKISTLLLIVILLSLGIYLLKSNKSVSPASVPVSTPALSPSPNLTANWKTYSNRIFAFSIRFPSNYTYDDLTNGTQVDRNSNLLIKSSEEPLEAYLEKNEDNLDQTNLVKNFSLGTLQISKLSLINAINSTYYAFVPINNQSLIIRFISDDQNSAFLFDQILSTFRFVDNQISTICGGWNTGGEIVCNCDGTLTKSICPKDAICDSGDYFCSGQCGSCCFNGIADNPSYPRCPAVKN